MNTLGGYRLPRRHMNEHSLFVVKFYSKGKVQVEVKGVREAATEETFG